MLRKQSNVRKKKDFRSSQRRLRSFNKENPEI